LHYFGEREVGEVTASPHIDKGGFTLHLFETDQGLEYLDIKTREWHEMPIGKNETVIIAGARLQNYSENNLKALCHRVVANEKTRRDGRYSAVLFVDFATAPLYDKDKFGRLQGFSAGFNYDMPAQEFSKMFTERRDVSH
jgi:isopenicillin N synthase-like dioxygenase